MAANVTAAVPLVREPGAGSILNILGSTHIYKATAAETGGSFSLWELIIPPGDGPPPHTHHREDEAFFVLSGELVFELEGDSGPQRIGAGGFIFGPRDHRHAFRNVGDQAAHLLVLTAPSVGIDQMFADLDAVTKRGIRDMKEIADICANYGVTIAPPA